MFNLNLICPDSTPYFLGLFDLSVAPQLLFYSYIPIIILTLFFGFYVYLKDNRSLRSRLLFYLSLTFALLLLNEIVQWVGSPASVVQFGWQLVPFFRLSVYLLTILFVFVFIEKKKISALVKILTTIPVVIVIILTPTTLNIRSFDLLNCEGVPGLLWNIVHLFEILLILSVLFLGIKSLLKNRADPKERKVVTYLTLGAVLFLSIFFIASIWGDITTIYDVALVGPVGMLAFIAFLTFMIVKFKAFDIKLLAVQALVWGLIILIGSQFFFIQNNTNRILTAFTLVGAAWVGLLIIRSVKKEVALREELEIANNNQQSLIHFISHQIKGFFTKSKMIFAGILEGDFGEASPTLKEMANVGMASDNNAVAMVQDILNASNLKKGTTNYSLKELDIVEVVKKVTAGFSEEINKKKLKYELDISDKPIIVMADETQITQVFKNLINNSLHYTPKGEIKVSLKMSRGNAYEATFSIQDTGVGLTEKDKSALFTEGGKGEESLKINTNSTGYGLYIVKKIVENHSGHIWAESAGRGHGSTFFVELPTIAKK